MNKPVLCNFIVIDSEPLPGFESERLRYLPVVHGYLYTRLFEYDPKSCENHYENFFNKMIKALPKELRDKDRIVLLGFAAYTDKNKLYYYVYPDFPDFDEKVFVQNNLNEIKKYVRSALPPPEKVILEKLIPCAYPFFGLAPDILKKDWWRIPIDLSSDVLSTYYDCATITGSDLNPSSLRASFIRNRGELMKPSWLYQGLRRKEAERRRETNYEMEIKQTLSFFRKVGIKTKPGMSEEEIALAEKRFRIKFPEDLRALLRTTVPVSEGFCDWTDLSEENVKYIQSKMDDPFLSIIFHASRRRFWPEIFGARPRKRQERVDIVKKRLRLAPKLIPVFGDCYISCRPHSDGNPVFDISMDYMREDSCGDISALDIWHFFQRTFESYEKWGKPGFDRRFAKKVPFWSRMI